MAVFRRIQQQAPPLLRRQSTCAALAYDYEAENEIDEPKLKLGSAWVEPMRGVQWVVIGEPGTKKHVYAGKLSKLLDVPHLSLSSLLRPELHPRSALYKQIANALNERKKVPEGIIFALLSKRLEEGYYTGETGFILDGIPQTRIQAEILDQVTDIDLVVNLKCAREHIRKKSFAARNVNFFGMDNCGRHPSLESSHERPGPSTSAWEEKLRIYTEQSKPLEDYYRRQKKLLDFQVAGAPSETWQGLLAALHLQHMNTVKSSHKPAV